MPIYEYECLSCGQRFDRLQKLSDPDPTDCPSCGAPQVKRALTAASFRLKGGGWYETDFKGDKDKKRNLVESGEAKSGDSKADSGSAPTEAAKPEAKADAKPETKVDKPASPAPGAASP